MKVAMRLALVASVLVLSSCFNVFSPFDHPTNDPQLISAARACLDRGDYSCALSDYQKLSGSSSDTANSEEAFTLYNKAGIDMGAFIGAFGSGNNSDAGPGITKIANGIPANVTDPGTGKKISSLLEIYHGYQKVTSINDQALRGIVRLVGAVGIITAILEDMATTQGNLLATDIVITPTACQNQGFPLCASTGSNPCQQGNDNVPTGTDINMSTATSTDDPLATAGDSVIVPSMGILYTAAQAAQIGLQDLGVASGSVSSILGALSASPIDYFTQDFGSNEAPCGRMTLIDQGIGG